MLLISSLILSGCGPEPEDKKSQQQQSTTPTDQQVLAAQHAAIKSTFQIITVLLHIDKQFHL